MKLTNQTFLELDPRMKLLLVAVFTSATFNAPNVFVLAWMDFFVILLFVARRLWKGARNATIIFGVFLLLELFLSFLPPNGICVAIGMILFMLERVAVFLVMGSWMGSKLRVSDFVTAMQNMHFPKGGTIALAVAFRYIPTVQDEFRSISNTMKLRGIGLNTKNILLHPLRTCEYAVIPLVIRSMTIADELAASAMTRGLDLDSKRTSYREVRIRIIDIAGTVLVILAVVGGVVINALFEGR